MKQFIFIGALALTSVMTGEAIAACADGGGWSRVTDLSAALRGNTACSLNGQGTQEEHHGTGTTGAVHDYKCGISDAAPLPPATWCQKPDTDRRKALGTWTVTSDASTSATVSYVYTAFNSPAYAVFFDGTDTYDFCNSGTSEGTFTLITTVSGSRVCPTPP